MKKYIYISLLAVIFTSCSKDFLDEKRFGQVLPSTYPQTVNQLEAFVTGLYAKINWSAYNEDGKILLYGTAADDMTTQSTKVIWNEWDEFKATDNNADLAWVWGYSYDLIKQANVIINVNVDASTYGYSQACVDRMKGQAYFARALAYFNLVRIYNYGNVPYLENPSASVGVLASDANFVYDKIISDLIQAETLLPVAYTPAGGAKDLTDLEKSTAYARITQGAAKSMLALVYLTKGGYPVNDNSSFALAAAKAKEVIDGVNGGIYSYRLLPNYADLWDASTGNNWTDIGNAEGIYTCFFNDKGAEGDLNMTFNGYMPEQLGGWSELYPEMRFFLDFPKGPRYDATFLLAATTKVNGKDSTFTYQKFTNAHPAYKKFSSFPGCDWNNFTGYTNWMGSNPVQVIRYAEVLLIYAEAQARAGSPDALAYECLNSVRSRAGLPNMSPGLSGVAFADSVVMERKWEFAGEHSIRWFDLVRTETVEKVTRNRIIDEEGKNGDWPILEINYPNDATHKGYWAPIPAQDKRLDPSLVDVTE